MISARHYGWLLLAFCLLIQTITVGTSIYGFAFFVLPWIRDFSTPRSELMIAMSGFSIVTAILSVFCGALVDRYSARKLVLVGACSYSGALFGMALAPSAIVVITIFALIAPIGMIFCGPLITQTLVARHFVERLGMALGICALGSSLGGLLMPPLITALLAHFDWRAVMAMLGLAGVLLIVPPALVLLRPHSGTIVHHKRGSLLRWLGTPVVLLLALAYVAPGAMFLAVLHNIGAYAADIGVSQQQAGAIVAITSLLMAVGKFAVGTLADRFSHTLLYFSLLSLVAIGMLLISSAGNVFSLRVGVPILGASMGGMVPLISAMVARRYGTEVFGSVIGVILAFAALSGLAPSAVGLIRDLTGSYTSAFHWLLLLLFPAALAILVLERIPQLFAPPIAP